MSYESLKAESIGWWECQDAAGNSAADASIHANHANISGGGGSRDPGPTTFLPSSIGLTGGDTIFLLNNSATSFVTGAAQRTICSWGKPTADDRAQRSVFLASGEPGFGITNGQALLLSSSPGYGVTLELGGHTVTSAVEILEQWNHYAVVVPPGATLTSDVQVWLNGAPLSLSTSAGSAKTLNTQFGEAGGFARAKISGSGYSAWFGYVAGVASFDRALSESELGVMISGVDSAGGGSGSAATRRRLLGLGGNLGVRR